MATPAICPTCTTPLTWLSYWLRLRARARRERAAATGALDVSVAALARAEFVDPVGDATLPHLEALLGARAPLESAEGEEVGDPGPPLAAAAEYRSSVCCWMHAITAYASYKLPEETEAVLPAAD